MNCRCILAPLTQISMSSTPIPPLLDHSDLLGREVWVIYPFPSCRTVVDVDGSSLRVQRGTAFHSIHLDDEGTKWCFVRNGDGKPNDEGLQRLRSSLQDVHTAAAAKMFGVPVAEVTPEQREVAKMITFHNRYAPMSPEKVANALGLGYPPNFPVGDVVKEGSPSGERIVQKVGRGFRVSPNSPVQADAPEVRTFKSLVLRYEHFQAARLRAVKEFGETPPTAPRYEGLRTNIADLDKALAELRGEMEQMTQPPSPDPLGTLTEVSDKRTQLVSELAILNTARVRVGHELRRHRRGAHRDALEAEAADLEKRMEALSSEIRGLTVSFDLHVVYWMTYLDRPVIYTTPAAMESPDMFNFAEQWKGAGTNRSWGYLSQLDKPRTVHGTEGLVGFSRTKEGADA